MITQGHATIRSLLDSSEGRRKLEEDFSVCHPNALDDKYNQVEFAGSGVIYLPIQSNDPACATDYCNIGKICAYITDESSGPAPYDKLVSFSKIQRNDKCMSASYNAIKESYKSAQNPGRSWLYQTCSEWGFYMTCHESSKCPYARNLPNLEVSLDLCNEAFGISADDVKKNIAYANEMYGGASIQGTRIMFPNGVVDPWSANGVLVSPNSQEPTFMVAGTSHHFWTHTSKPTDSEAVVAAREKIWKFVEKSLAET